MCRYAVHNSPPPSAIIREKDVEPSAIKGRNNEDPAKFTGVAGVNNGGETRHEENNNDRSSEQARGTDQQRLFQSSVEEAANVTQKERSHSRASVQKCRSESEGGGRSDRRRSSSASPSTTSSLSSHVYVSLSSATTPSETLTTNHEVQAQQHQRPLSPSRLDQAIVLCPTCRLPKKKEADALVKKRVKEVKMQAKKGLNFNVFVSPTFVCDIQCSFSGAQVGKKTSKGTSLVSLLDAAQSNAREQQDLFIQTDPR